MVAQSADSRLKPVRVVVVVVVVVYEPYFLLEAAGTVADIGLASHRNSESSALPEIPM